jgi:hypothetical protein
MLHDVVKLSLRVVHACPVMWCVHTLISRPYVAMTYLMGIKGHDFQQKTRRYCVTVLLRREVDGPWHKSVLDIRIPSPDKTHLLSPMSSVAGQNPQCYPSHSR